MVLGLWLLLVIKVDPVIVADILLPKSYLLFFGLWWEWTFLVILALTGRLVRALVWSTGLAFFLGLRLMKMGHILNALLVLAILLTFEFFYAQRKSDSREEERVD